MAEFYRKKLKNGMIILFEKRDIDVVSVASTIKFGAAYEDEKIKGISHFLEHLMFKGTKTRSHEEIVREIEKKGGILNAYTSEEITSYWAKLPSKHFFSGLNITSDLILNPKIDKIEFEKEKNVIIEEIKMYKDNPLYYVNDKIKEFLYKKPFGMSIAGKEEIIKKLTREEVIELFKKNYTADSMILTAVGKVDFDEICKKVETIFPSTKRSLIEHNPVKITAEEIEKRKGIDQAHFVFGFHSPSLIEKEKHAYEIAGVYLFGGMSSVLFEEIREKRGLAYAVKGSFDLGKKFGYGTIYVGTMKEKVKEVKEIILTEIKNLKDLKQKDFEECKEQLIGNKNIVEEDSTNVMNALMIEETAGNAEEYYKYEERIRAVKLDDVRKIAKLKSFSSFALVPE